MNPHDPLDRPAGLVLALQKARRDLADSERREALRARERDEYKERLHRVISVRCPTRPEEWDDRFLTLRFSRGVLRQARNPVSLIMSEVEHHLRKEF